MLEYESPLLQLVVHAGTSLGQTYNTKRYLKLLTSRVSNVLLGKANPTTDLTSSNKYSTIIMIDVR
jgi:hypothetical protein